MIRSRERTLIFGAAPALFVASLLSVCTVAAAGPAPPGPTPAAPRSAPTQSSQPAATKPDWTQPVTLQVEDLPLRVLLQNLSKATGVTLEPDRSLQECKAMVIVHARSLADVMKGLAEVFGAQWVTFKRDGKDVYQLRYLKAISDYLAFRDQSRKKARDDARDWQYRVIMNQIDYVFAHLDDAKDPGVSHVIDANGLPLITSVQSMALARLLKSLPPDDVQRFAHALADAIPLDGIDNRDHAAARLDTPPVILNADGLSGDQASLEQQYLANQAQDQALSGIPANPAGVSLGLIDSNGSDLGIEWMTPGQSQAPFSEALSFAPSSPEALAARANAEWRAALSKHPFPPEALLGAVFDKDGNPQPAVSLQPDLAGKMVNLLGNPPLRWQLLAFLGEHEGLNVISDYATLCQRTTLRRGPQTLQTILDDTSKSCGAVFREDKRILLGRYIYWPDLNDNEAPWPLPENLIRKKTKGQGLDFDDYIALAGLDSDQLNALARYQDHNVSFVKNISSLKANPDFRALLASCAALSPADRAAVAAGGVSGGALPLAVQRQMADLPLVKKNGTPAAGLLLRLLKYADQKISITDSNGLPTANLILSVRDPVAKRWLGYYTLDN